MEIHIIGSNGKEVFWLSEMLSRPRQGRIVSYAELFYEWRKKHNCWEKEPTYWREIDGHAVPFFGAIQFISRSDIEAYFDERYTHSEWKKKMCTENKNAMTYYSGEDYKHINRNLRKCHKENIPIDRCWEMSSEEREHIRNLDQAISSYVLEEPIRVYRSIGNNMRDTLLSKIKNKENFSDGAYMSSSCYRLCKMLHRRGTDLMVIDVPPGKGYGAYIAEYSKYQNQHEFLMSRFIELKPIEAKEIGGRYVFFMEAVLTKGKNRSNHNLPFVW